MSKFKKLLFTLLFILLIEIILIYLGYKNSTTNIINFNVCKSEKTTIMLLDIILKANWVELIVIGSTQFALY